MTRRPEPSSPFPPLRLVRGGLPAPPAITRRLRARPTAGLPATPDTTPERPVYRVEFDISEFGLLAGDRIVLDGPHEVSIVRRVRITDAQLATLRGTSAASSNRPGGAA